MNSSHEILNIPGCECWLLPLTTPSIPSYSDTEASVQYTRSTTLLCQDSILQCESIQNTHAVFMSSPSIGVGGDIT